MPASNTNPENPGTHKRARIDSAPQKAPGQITTQPKAQERPISEVYPSVLPILPSLRPLPPPPPADKHQGSRAGSKAPAQEWIGRPPSKARQPGQILCGVHNADGLGPNIEKSEERGLLTDAYVDHFNQLSTDIVGMLDTRLGHQHQRLLTNRLSHTTRICCTYQRGLITRRNTSLSVRSTLPHRVPSRASL